MPQPYLVPVSPATSRMAQRSGMSGGTSTVVSLPFRVNVAMDGFLIEDQSLNG